MANRAEFLSWRQMLPRGSRSARGRTSFGIRPSAKFLAPAKSVWSLGYCRLAFLTLSSSHF